MISKETTIQMQVADYLALQYPDIIFHSDFGSGVKLNEVQSALQKRLNGGRKSYPDMFIAQPMAYAHGAIPMLYRKYNLNSMFWVRGDYVGACGLYLELKKDGTKLIRDKDARKILKGETKLRKRGDWWDLHTEEQALMLEKLRNRGYCAEFAVGFDEAKKIINEYLGKPERHVEF